MVLEALTAAIFPGFSVGVTGLLKRPGGAGVSPGTLVLSRLQSPKLYCVLIVLKIIMTNVKR